MKIYIYYTEWNTAKCARREKNCVWKLSGRKRLSVRTAPTKAKPFARRPSDNSLFEKKLSAVTFLPEPKKGVAKVVAMFRPKVHLPFSTQRPTKVRFCHPWIICISITGPEDCFYPTPVWLCGNVLNEAVTVSEWRQLFFDSKKWP